MNMQAKKELLKMLEQKVREKERELYDAEGESKRKFTESMGNAKSRAIQKRALLSLDLAVRQLRDLGYQVNDWSLERVKNDVLTGKLSVSEEAWARYLDVTLRQKSADVLANGLRVAFNEFRFELWAKESGIEAEVQKFLSRLDAFKL